MTGEPNIVSSRTKEATWSALAFVAVLAGYAVLAGIVAFNKLPWCDEGWYGAPALNLAKNGSMGTPNFYYVKLPGVIDYTYWEMPGFIVVLAGWFKVVGGGLLQARALTCILGAVVLVLWSLILRRLGAKVWERALAVALIATDQFFILDATYARADMQSLVLLSAALWLYLRHRERSFTKAIILGNVAVAAAALTHPNAGLLGLAALCALALPDRRRLRWYDVPLCALPYVIGSALWWLYIRQAPDLFAAQFSANAGGRFSAILSPLESIRSEISERYFLAFGLGAHSSGTPKLVVLKVAGLLAWICGVLGCLAVRSLRKRHLTRVLLAWLAIDVLYLTFFEGTRTTTYLIWLVPIFSALVARWCVCEWERRSLRRWPATAIIALAMAVQGGTSLAKARLQWGMRPFREAVQFLQAQGRGRPIVASIEFGYALGFEPGAFYDDVSLGGWSQINPGYVVLEDRYRDWLPAPRGNVPDEVHAAGRWLVSSCAPAFDNTYYTIYRCQERGEVTDSGTAEPGGSP
jgi:4-amino-4-deoxy-L-arabinose transferase-like glycosyltransferase